MNPETLPAVMADAVIAFVLLEGVLLALLRWRRGRGPAPADVACQLGAGLCLLGALRSQITTLDAAACAAWLAAAGVFHALDLLRRWPAAPSIPDQETRP